MICVVSSYDVSTQDSPESSVGSCFEHICFVESVGMVIGDGAVKNSVAVRYLFDPGTLVVMVLVPVDDELIVYCARGKWYYIVPQYDHFNCLLIKFQCSDG